MLQLPPTIVFCCFSFVCLSEFGLARNWSESRILAPVDILAIRSGNGAELILITIYLKQFVVFRSFFFCRYGICLRFVINNQCYLFCEPHLYAFFLL